MSARLRATGADCVVVAPTREAGLPIRAGKIGLFAPDLVGTLLSAGDRLSARVHGAGTIDVRVIETLPAGRVIVDDSTILLVAMRCRPSTPHPCRRSAPSRSWV